MNILLIALRGGSPQLQPAPKFKRIKVIALLYQYRSIGGMGEDDFLYRQKHGTSRAMLSCSLVDFNLG
jgi:hypothetical protein